MATAIRYGSVYKTLDSAVDIASLDGDSRDVASVGLSVSEAMAAEASKAGKLVFSGPTFASAGTLCAVLGATWDPYCPD